MHSVLYGKFSVQSKKTRLVLSPHRHSTTAIVSPHTMAFARFPRFIRWLGEKNFIWNNIDAETLFAFSMLCEKLQQGMA